MTQRSNRSNSSACSNAAIQAQLEYSQTGKIFGSKHPVSRSSHCQLQYIWINAFRRSATSPTGSRWCFFLRQSIILIGPLHAVEEMSNDPDFKRDGLYVE
jgi:hypothetical protein